MPLVLHDHPDSPNCRKVRLTLAVLDVPHERRRVDLLAGETRTPAFLALNPRGQIPVLVDGDLVLPESTAILLYLAERHGPHLRGRGAAGRAQVARWLCWQGAGASRTIAAVGFQRLIRPARGQPPDERAIQPDLAAWRRDADALELHLARGGWLVDELTVADLGVGVWLDLADRAGMLADHPAARRYVDRIRALPAWPRAGDYDLLGRASCRSSSSSSASTAG